MLWIRAADWVHRDSFEVGENIEMPSRVWNPIMVFPFVVAFLVTLILPIFAIGYTLLFAGYAAPLVTYILMRNGRVTRDQRVLTPSHIKRWARRWPPARRSKKTETLMAHEQGPPIQLTACGGTDSENQAHLIMARQSPGYVLVKALIADLIQRRADRVMLDYSKEAVAVRYEIDGVWQNVEPQDRESGDVILAVMKKLCSLDMDERRARQEGMFKAKMGRKKYACRLVSQGTKTGERAVLELEPEKIPFRFTRIARHARQDARTGERGVDEHARVGAVQLAASGWLADHLEYRADRHRSVPAGFLCDRGSGQTVHARGERGGHNVRWFRRPDPG